MEYLLEIYNLEKKYKNFKAISNLSMRVEKGSIYGLIGKNGSGKTTLMRLICGLQKASNGYYKICGIPNGDKKIIEMRKKMGAMIEKSSAYSDMTAEENLKEQYKIIGVPFNESKLNEILVLVGLDKARKKKFKEFSLGMKQRLGIAIALIGNPNFLILDEPINGLDPEGIIEVRELILKLNKEKGITFLISSHYLDELSKIATHYGFLNNGKIIQEITNDKLKENCKKRLEIDVNNTKECVKYLEEKNISYEVVSEQLINIYSKVNITEFTVALSKRNCIVNEFHEKEETLENYYIKLIGGLNNE